jgi:NADPH:quinone reductase-like Zn-dependent oxidoreductase
VFVDYGAGDPFQSAVQAIGGDVDAVADLYGHGSVSQALPFVREGGQIATIVELKGDFELAIDRNITLHGVLVQPSRPLLHSLSLRVSRHELQAAVQAVYDLDHVKQLHERLDSGHAQGKAVLATSTWPPTPP